MLVGCPPGLGGPPPEGLGLRDLGLAGRALYAPHQHGARPQCGTIALTALVSGHHSRAFGVDVLGVATDPDV